MYPPGTLVRDTTGAKVVTASMDVVVVATLVDEADVLVEEMVDELLADEAEDDDEDVEEDVVGDADGKPNGLEAVALGVDEVVEVTIADSVLVADTAGIVEEASIEAGAVC